jgi:frataxin-like iron-binding protein CyaY
MVEVKPKYSKEEFSRRGEEIFEREIREKVEGEDPEKFVSIDIETGDFEVDADMLEAIHRLRKRNPMAQVWTRTVGSKYAFHFGGRPASESR